MRIWMSHPIKAGVLSWLLFLVGGVVPEAYSQGKDLIRLEQLQEAIRGEKDRIQVINFWATWCAPCLKEMPLFEKMNSERNDIRIRLVSLDLDLDPDVEKVRNFVIRKKIKSEVIILDEQNPNSWIEKIDKGWSGALPATLVINNKNGKRKFVEGELHAGDIEKLIEEVL